MMRYRFLAVPLHLFHSVIKEEINQNRINVRFWVLPLDLPPNQLDTPNATRCSSLVGPLVVEEDHMIQITHLEVVAPSVHRSRTSVCL